jgi:hypothetical protein
MNSFEPLGTLAWARRTGGRITDDDEALLAGQIADVLDLANVAPTTLTIDLDDLAVPESSLTREAQ